MTKLATKREAMPDWSKSIFANKSIRSIYIAGPMTNIDQHNFPLFDSSAAILRGDFYECSHPDCLFTISEDEFLVAKESYDAEKSAFLKEHRGDGKKFKLFTLCPYHPKYKMRKSKFHLEHDGVINPAELDSEQVRKKKLKEKSGKPVLESGGPLWSQLIRRDQELVARVDAIVVLPNWQKSRGAKEEVREAVGGGTLIYEMDTLMLLPVDQHPRLSPGGNVLDEALWVTEGNRGDNFTHPARSYGEVAEMWKARGLGRWSPEAVAYALLIRADEELASGPTRDSAVKIIGLYRCIEQIAEVSGGWERLSVLPRKAARARRPKDRSRSVGGVKIPLYELSVPVFPDAERKPYLPPAGENLITEAMCFTEWQDEQVSPGAYYGAIAREWEKKGRGKWRWTPEAVIYELAMRADHDLSLSHIRESALTVVILYRHIEQMAEELGGWHRLYLNPILAS